MNAATVALIGTKLHRLAGRPQAPSAFPRPPASTGGSAAPLAVHRFGSAVR
jgi:hypothetical protein